MVEEDLLDHKEETEWREVAAYDYRDATGEVLYQVVLLDPKRFLVCRPDGNGWCLWNLDGGKRVLYHLPEVIEATGVLVVEGEQDANTAASFGFVATTNPGGPGKWRKEYSETLRGKHVTIIPDADALGRGHARQVVKSLSGIAASIKVLTLPRGKDLTEWVATGGSAEELSRLIQDAPAPPKILSARDKVERALLHADADLAQDTNSGEHRNALRNG